MNRKVMKLIATVLMLGLIFACAPKPIELGELNDAKAALNAAKNAEAEKCAKEEFAAAKAKLDAGEAKLKEAEQATAQTEKDALAEEAKALVLESLELFDKAQKVAEENAKLTKQAEGELSALETDFATVADDAKVHSGWNYNNITKLINSAKDAISKCQGKEALDMIEEAKGILAETKEIVAEAKALEQELNGGNKLAALAAATNGNVSYKVVKGDNLWNIAKDKYMNAFFWPLIYWANKADIKDPDLIFPGQVFDIRYDAPVKDQVEAEKFAKTRGPWSLFDGK